MSDQSIVGGAYRRRELTDETAPAHRDAMRGYIKEFGPHKFAVCAAYAAAERRGEITRAGAEDRLLPEEYARALWRDGKRKGWLFD